MGETEKESHAKRAELIIVIKFFLSIFKSIVVFPAVLVLTVLSIAITAGFFGDVSQICELASHFRYLYLIAFIPFFLFVVLMRCWKATCIFLVFLLANTAAFVPFYLRLTPPPSNAPNELGVLQFNVWGPKNEKHAEVLSLVKDKNPDIIGVTEITQTWVDVLSKGLPDYKYRVIEKRYGGVALFSKIPLSNAHVIYYGEIKRPRIEADIKIGDRKVAIIFAHPVIPKGKFENRNGELAEIGSSASNKRKSVIIFGDLNCSPWSYYFWQLLKSADLQDTEDGFGFNPTWSTQFLFPYIPIDHCLVSQSFSTLQRTVGPDIGSDHLPVYVKLGLYPTN